jgi:hypothetical protein
VRVGGLAGIVLSLVGNRSSVIFPLITCCSIITPMVLVQLLKIVKL